jgi:nicotinamidase-related amidase
MKPDLTDAVLLPIDMQQAFDHAPWPKRWNADCDAHGLMLLEQWRRADRPIIHVRHDSVVPKSTLGPGQPGNAFRDGYGPQGDEALVSKSVNSAFIGTDLDLRLRRLGAQSIVVFGITTDMCVSTTIRMAANMGWRMILVHDACDCCELGHVTTGDVIPARDVHDAHVATLAAEFCTALSTQDVLRL